ncbi:MAG TPA: hypothetical protein DD669_14920 [Pseudomonas sp.]|nr:hypothetical protein [Pseudomonas sp.]
MIRWWCTPCRSNPPPCGSGLARDGSAVVTQTNRAAIIASKPAPTLLNRVINPPTAATVRWHALRTVAATLPAYVPGPHRPGSAHTA